MSRVFSRADGGAEPSITKIRYTYLTYLEVDRYLRLNCFEKSKDNVVLQVGAIWQKKRLLRKPHRMMLRRRASFPETHLPRKVQRWAWVHDSDERRT